MFLGHYLMVARVLPGHCYVVVVMSVVGCSWGL